MTRKLKLILLAALPLLGILAGYLLMARSVTITVDGETSEITTHALTVRGALRSAGYKISPLDRVLPPASTWLSRATAIVLKRAHDLQIWDDRTSQLIAVDIPVTTPAEMLVAAGITPSRDDLVRVNGLPVPMDQPLERNGPLVLQYTPSVRIVVNRDGTNSIYQTSATMVGMALWQQGIQLHGGDALSQSFTGGVDGQSTLIINSAVPLVITADGRDVSTFVTAATVGEALAIAGITLQDLDYSRPAETEPLPEDGRIVVVRVREEILSETQTVPYSTEATKTDSLDYGVKQVVQAGEFGLQITRVAVRYEDGVEVTRTNLDTVVLKEAVNQIENVGTKVTAQTVTDTSCAGVQSYLAMDVTTTSYSPCNSGADTCYPYAASGAVVQQGVLAVSSAWYKILKGTQICIPGYGIGTVQDIGSYPNNPNWIDLGYTDEQLAAVPVTEWTHLHITVYFMSPKAAELAQ